MDVVKTILAFVFKYLRQIFILNGPDVGNHDSTVLYTNFISWILYKTIRNTEKMYGSGQ